MDVGAKVRCTFCDCECSAEKLKATEYKCPDCGAAVELDNRDEVE